MVFRIFRLSGSSCGECDLQNLEPGLENFRRINHSMQEALIGYLSHVFFFSFFPLSLKGQTPIYTAFCFYPES